MTSPACLSDDDVHLFVEGRLSGERLAEAERHLANCSECPRLVADAARETGAMDPTTASAASDARLAEGPLAEGTRVGRYVVRRTLGEGAMGRVYAAHDPELDRVVALKVLHPRLATDDLEARLRREAKAMARVTHAEVITIYDAGRHGDQLFLAMELVEGGTLRQWLDAKKRSWREVLAVFARAGRGLAEAHAAGIVHRDFKPDNVLIGVDGRVRVTDFGLARPAQATAAALETNDESGDRDGGVTGDDGSLTRTGALVGTPAYMAPAQLTGTAGDVRADIYAFAVSLYEGLYGEGPFASGSLLANFAAKSVDDVRPAPANTDVPVRVRRVVLSGLRARAEDRWGSIDALLVALERAARTRRAPWIAGAAVAAIALAAIGYARASRSPIPRASSVAPPVSTCKASACSAEHGGAPYACRPRDGACVPIASDDCVASFEPSDLTRDDTLWLGAMLPTKGPSADAFGTMNARGADFARKEIADATSALGGPDASKHVRRIALVTCDDGTDAERAAHHLVEDVGVPAILGFSSGQKLVDLAGAYLIPRRVLSVATLTTNPLVTRVPQPDDLPRMVWRTPYSRNDVAVATARFLHDVLEPNVPEAARPTRITLARIDMPAGAWFSEELYRRVVFNGKSAVENGDAYAEVLLPATLPSPAALQALADRVIATRPTFVVLTGDTAVMAPLVVSVEARWRGGSRPTYVLSDDSTGSLAAWMGANVERRRRVFAVTSLSNEAPSARFVIRYNQSHDAEQVTRYVNPGTTYDAVYLLAYATYAIGPGVIDGPSLARAFARLVPPGKPIEVGPTPLFDGIAALQTGQSIDLRGASSPLDFNLATGETPVDFALVCADVDPRGQASGDREAGVYYRTATRSIEGALRCR